MFRQRKQEADYQINDTGQEKVVFPKFFVFLARRYFVQGNEGEQKVILQCTKDVHM
jgi:hypothetical protein